MQGRKKGLKSAICGGGALKPLRSPSYGAENRFATNLQGGCGGLAGLCGEWITRFFNRKGILA